MVRILHPPTLVFYHMKAIGLIKASTNVSFFVIHSRGGPIVEWIQRGPPKTEVQVRFLLGLPFRTYRLVISVGFFLKTLIFQ